MRFFTKNSCAAPLARFTAGLYALIVCFRAHCCAVACITIFINAFFRNSVFERWIILSFCKINWEISGAAFLLVEMTVFWGIFDMCRAKFWGDSFTACFDFCHCMCNSVVALFFAVLLCTAWLILGPNSSLLRVFAVCRFTSYHFLVLRNYWLSYFASCCASAFLNTSFWQQQLVLWWLLRFLSILLLGLVLACFRCKIGLCTNLYLLVLFFFVHFLRLCVLALFIHSYASILQPLTSTNYAYCPLCSVFLHAQS